MLAPEIGTVPERRAVDYAWRRLMQFKDIERASQILIESRKIPSAQHSNVRKQVRQLAFCVQQAQEFANSAKSTGPTTRALLAYYCLTALANAEILWKGDGNVSFERRNGRFNAHGLELKRGETLMEYSAAPSEHGSGLFALWRKYAAHEHPVAELRRVYVGDSEQQTSYAWPNAVQLGSIALPNRPLSLEECLGSVPAMHDSVRSSGHKSLLVRGRISETATMLEHGTAERSVTIIFHPSEADVFEDVASKFVVKPEFVADLRIAGRSNSAIVNFTSDIDASIPECATISLGNSYFFGSGDFLNEFGYYYTGLYICGMVTRYHPQIWIGELSKGSYITGLIDEFVDHALERAPLLVLGQLTDSIVLYA